RPDGTADADDRPHSSPAEGRCCSGSPFFSGIGVTTARQGSERHPENDQDSERTLQHMGGPFGQRQRGVLHTRYDSLAAPLRKGRALALPLGRTRTPRMTTHVGGLRAPSAAPRRSEVGGSPPHARTRFDSFSAYFAPFSTVRGSRHHPTVSIGFVGCLRSVSERAAPNRCRGRLSRRLPTTSPTPARTHGSRFRSELTPLGRGFPGFEGVHLERELDDGA